MDRLGRGIDALIPKDFDETILANGQDRIQKLLINDVHPNPSQPRREFNDAAHNELVSSVKRHGVLQPIIVVRDNNGYQLVAGERRWRAARDAKLDHIPAIVRSLADLEQIELALIENIQRVDLSPLEQAFSVLKLQQQFNLKVEEIAQKLGKAPSTLSNLTRLLQLPKAATEALRTGKISEGHARSILALKGHPDKQAELLQCILDNSWSVRQAEQYVLSTKKAIKTGNQADASPNDQTIAKRIGQKLDAKVSIKRTAKGGQLSIVFTSDQDLERLAERLEKI